MESAGKCDQAMHAAAGGPVGGGPVTGSDPVSSDGAGRAGVSTGPDGSNPGGTGPDGSEPASTGAARPPLAPWPGQGPGERSNTELVLAARAGDQEAWNALVGRYETLLWNLTRQFRLGRADAADVVQTTWLRLLESLGKVADPERLAGWLSTTARRECLRVSRRGDYPRPGDDFAMIPDAGPAPGDRLLRSEQNAELWAALDRLSEPCQRLLRVFMSDPPPTYAEAALILDMKVGSIGPTRQRCLAHLRKLAGIEGLGPSQ